MQPPLLLAHALQQASAQQASDLYLTPGAAPRLKVEGEMITLPGQTLTAAEIQSILQQLLNPEQQQRLTQQRELDWAFALPGGERCRVNAFYRQGEPALVLRLLRADIPELDALGVPSVLGELILHKRGLLLVVGGTGSGKSTTLAAMIQHRNSRMAGHILTIEDPVEFVHPHRLAIVNQREVGQDTLSYQAALQSAMREAPDLILIGEIRDRLAMEAALQLAGTGHLALSTLHANNACQALTRIINLFPQSLHRQVWMDLSLYLRAIIAQRLVPGTDGRRKVAVEVLLNTPHVAELILQGDVDGVQTALQESREPGMLSFDQALLQLQQAGSITLQEALNHADSRANLQARIHFG
ncbi:MAG: PilT/PilU family type 4a pilus ATPase [Magnetococcales bacterium]|nr:PilT/PilU family type 4a pilus ATPase [Magnetococcales bacterium]